MANDLFLSFLVLSRVSPLNVTQSPFCYPITQVHYVPTRLPHSAPLAYKHPVNVKYSKPSNEYQIIKDIFTDSSVLEV